MRISYLEEFIALASYSKLTTAARALHMSHSALSQHLALLEKEFGCELFSRNGGFALTPEGEIALEHAQKVVNDYNELLRSCAINNQDIVRLRTSDYEICQAPLERARQPFLEAHPSVDIVLTYDAYQCDDSIDLLVDGERDVAILLTVRGSGQRIESMMSADITWFRACAFRLIFACNDANPCAGKAVLTADDLQGATVVSSLCPASITLMAGVSDFLETYGVHIRPSFKPISSNADALLGDLGDRFVLLYEPLEGADVLPAPELGATCEGVGVAEGAEYETCAVREVGEDVAAKETSAVDPVAAGIDAEVRASAGAESSAATGRFEHDIIADAYILYRPESLNPLQLEYLELARSLNKLPALV